MSRTSSPSIGAPAPGQRRIEVTASSTAARNVRQKPDPGSTVDCGSNVELTLAYRPGELYAIQDGDTYESIAAAHGITVEQLLGFSSLTVAELSATGETPTSSLKAGGALRISAVSEALRQLQYRVDLASSQLQALGFPNTESSTDAAGVTTIVAIDRDQSRTLTITMTPGTMLLPENHNRAPITTTENTADRISMEYNSNNGWRFMLVVERAGATALPSEDELGNLLYGIDP